MARIKKYPDQISAIFDGLPYEEWNGAALNRFLDDRTELDSDDINLLSGTSVRVNYLQPYNIVELRNSAYIAKANATGDTIRVIGGIPGGITPFVKDTRYGFQVLGMTVADKAGKTPTGGKITFPVDWIEAGGVAKQNRDLAVTLPARTSTIGGVVGQLNIPARANFKLGSPMDSGAWGSTFGLNWSIDTRKIKGVPTGCGVFDPDGGKTLRLSTGEIENKPWLANGFTLELLFKGTDPTVGNVNRYLLSWLATWGGNGLMNVYVTPAGQLRINIMNSNATIANTLFANEVHHLVISYGYGGSSDLAVWLNGELAVAMNAPRVDALTTEEIRIGGRNTASGDQSYISIIHQFRVFNKTFSDTDVQRLWNNGRPWDVILTRIEYAADADDGVDGAPGPRTGCLFEFLPQNIIPTALGVPTDGLVWRCSSLQRGAVIVQHEGGQEMDISFIDPETNEDVPAADRLLMPMTISVTRLVIQQFNGTYIDWEVTPGENPYSENDTEFKDIEVLYGDENNPSIITLSRAAVPTESGILGVVKGDLHSIAKRLLAPKQIIIDGDTLSDVYIKKDGQLAIEYAIRLKDAPNTLVSNRIGINAVSQYGRTYETDKNRILISVPPTKYVGHPLEIAILSPLANIIRIPSIGYEYGVANEHLLVGINIEGETHIDMVGVEMTIREGCMPAEPFYIRWINDLGGYDYKMFAWLKTTEEEITGLQNIQKAPLSPYHTQETVYAEGNVYVTTGQDGLQKSEFDALKMIARSPFIQWWDPELQKWFTILISDESKLVWNSDSALGSVEFTFQMPRLKLQF